MWQQASGLFYDQAFLAIVEHCDVETCRAFDHDNKAFQSVINALKGRVFPDDNQFELSLGLFTRLVGQVGFRSRAGLVDNFAQLAAAELLHKS